jgi:uncharacterized membrane protein
METKKKSLKKAISWTIIDNIATISVAYAFTQQIGLSFGIAIISNTIEVLLYYIHERFWSKKNGNI